MFDIKQLSESIKIGNTQMVTSHDFSTTGKNFSYRHSICPQHPQNYIVNFCLNPECLKPLCAECIKIHGKEHATKGTHGQFETIEEISEQTHQQMLRVRQMYKEQQYQIYNYQQSLDNQEYILREKLKIAKEKIQLIIDEYFLQIEKDLQEKSKHQKSKQASDLNMLIRKINDNEEELTHMQQKMMSPQFTKQVQQFLSQPYEKNAKVIQTELERTTQVLESQLLDVMFDEGKINSLQETIKGYIKMHNSDYYPDIGVTQEVKNTSEKLKTKEVEGKNPPQKNKGKELEQKEKGLLNVNYKAEQAKEKQKNKKEKKDKKEQQVKKEVLPTKQYYSQVQPQTLRPTIQMSSVFPKQPPQKLFSPMGGQSMYQFGNQNQQMFASSNYPQQFQPSRSINFH